MASFRRRLALAVTLALENTTEHAWTRGTGTRTARVGSSPADLPLRAEVEIR